LEIEIPATVSANIILPEDYQNATIEMVDLAKNREANTNIKEGVLKVKPGKYQIIAEND
jgi:hypothetical protein